MYNAQYRAKNREKLLKQKLEWYYANKQRSIETSRIANRKRWYGIDNEKYTQMLLEQHSTCAICKQPETTKNPSGELKSLAVDHCHTTGKVRGLLCNTCNTALGKFKDDITLLENAVLYLKGSW